MIDVKQQVNAVARTVGNRRLEAGEARVSTIGQIYDTGIDDLWDVVTNVERIPRWFLPISGDLRLGGKYQFEGNAGGSITACEPPRSFAATWEFGDQVSWIEVRLSEVGDGRTRFELEHVAHVADELWEQFGPGATGLGWDSGLLGLANHLADPSAPLNPEEAAAWIASEDGKLFLRLSADAWADAAIASGDDEVTARTAADRIYGMYTGASEG